jgi:hypothetical protein
VGCDVGGQFGDGEGFGGDEADGDGGVQMAAGDVADGEGHGEDSESEGEGHADVTDTKVDAGGEDAASATAKDKPEGTEELGCCTFRESHRVTRTFLWCDFCLREVLMGPVRSMELAATCEWSTLHPTREPLLM